MSFLDNLEKQELYEPYVIDGNYEVEQWIYVDPDTDQFYKAKIIKPFLCTRQISQNPYPIWFLTS